MAEPGLTITGLRVVQKAAVLGSFSAAAEALGYTQPAISRQVASMEAVVGFPLFERVARGVRPTEAGTVLAEHATAVVATLEAAQTALRRLRERLEGRLVLGAMPVAMSVLVPRAVARLAHVNPGLNVSLHEAPTPILVERVRHGLLDVGVIALGEELPPYDLEGLRRDVLLADALRVAVPAGHRFAGRRRVPVHELRDEPWIVGRAIGEHEPIFGAWPTLADPRVAFTSRDWPSRLGLVAAGLGLAVVPSIVIPSVPAGVAVIEVEDPDHRKRSAVALTPSDPSAAAAAMVSALRTEAARIALARPRIDQTSQQ